jgi:hypothetical protein
MARLCLILVGFGLWALGSTGSRLKGVKARGRSNRRSSMAWHIPPSIWSAAGRRRGRAPGSGARSGEAHLEFEVGSGYLRSLLRALDIDTDTQLAVFSKTSLQSPSSARATRGRSSSTTASPWPWPRGGFIELAARIPRRAWPSICSNRHPDRRPASGGSTAA